MPFLFTSPYILATPGFSFLCFSPAIGQHFVAFQPLREKKETSFAGTELGGGEHGLGTCKIFKILLLFSI